MRIERGNYYRCTPYGELTIFDDQPLGAEDKNRAELMDWCKSINSSLIYIWIDKERLSHITVSSLIQLFLDLAKYQPKSRVIVQWRMEAYDIEMKSVVDSLQRLFPKVSFLVKRN